MPSAECMSLPPAGPPEDALRPVEAASSPGTEQPPVGSAAWAHARKPRLGHSEPGVASGWVDRGSRDASPPRTEGFASPGIGSGHKACTLQPAASGNAAPCPAVPHSKTLKRASLRLRAHSAGALADAQAKPDVAHANGHPRSDHDGSGALLLLNSEVRLRLRVALRTRLLALPPAWLHAHHAAAQSQLVAPRRARHLSQSGAVRGAPDVSPCELLQATDTACHDAPAKRGLLCRPSAWAASVAPAHRTRRRRPRSRAARCARTAAAAPAAASPQAPHPLPRPSACQAPRRCGSLAAAALAAATAAASAQSVGWRSGRAAP